MFKGIDHIVVAVKDLDASVANYETAVLAGQGSFDSVSRFASLTAILRSG